MSRDQHGLVVSVDAPEEDLRRLSDEQLERVRDAMRHEWHDRWVEKQGLSQR